MKICVMGNSHTGSLKRAWDKISFNYPNLEIVFFAKRQTGIKNFRVQNKKLIPIRKDLKKAIEFTSGGLNHIDPKDYDLFLLYGLRDSLYRDSFYFEQSGIFFSKQVKTLALNDWSENNITLQLVKMLRKLTKRKVYIGHQPLRAAPEILSTTEPSAYIKCINYLNEAIYDPLHAELIAQPTITIVNGNRTNPNYTKGSKKFSEGDLKNIDEAHSLSDRGHMNDEFGEIWLKAFLEKALQTQLI